MKKNIINNYIINIILVCYKILLNVRSLESRIFIFVMINMNILQEGDEKSSLLYTWCLMVFIYIREIST